VPVHDSDVAFEQLTGVDVRDRPAPDEEVGGVLTARDLEQPSLLFHPYLHLSGPVAYDVAVEALGAALLNKVLEVSKSLGQRETELVV
jgi:hypothetical protein